MLVKRKIVVFWMILGLFMVFFQIIIGGVTRLTGSGLSITKWEIITGTIPPLNAGEWEESFELYKDTPQYRKLNEGMSMSEFKFIYFWEYLHRLWARFMGLVFIIPFIFFLHKRWLNRRIIRRLVILVILAAVVGLFGWIMVASGLIERPWVNAYKLSIHLCLALVVYSHLLWTVLLALYGESKKYTIMRRTMLTFLILLGVQIFLGGMMSGMKASLLYSTWPKMGTEWIPSILFEPAQWNVNNFVDYDTGPFLVTIVQFFHRGIAYILILFSLYIFFKSNRILNLRHFKSLNVVFITMLIIQMVLGITTLIRTVGTVPVLYGVLHQAGAIFVLTISIILFYFHSYKSTVY